MEIALFPPPGVFLFLMHAKIPFPQPWNRIRAVCTCTSAHPLLVAELCSHPLFCQGNEAPPALRSPGAHPSGSLDPSRFSPPAPRATWTYLSIPLHHPGARAARLWGQDSSSGIHKLLVQALQSCRCIPEWTFPTPVLVPDPSAPCCSPCG